jgi:SAM-dependent methyltransferase
VSVALPRLTSAVPLGSMGAAPALRRRFRSFELAPLGGRVLVSDDSRERPSERAPADAPADDAGAVDAPDSPTATHLRIPLTGGAYLEQARRQLFARNPEYLPYFTQRLAVTPGMTVIEVGCGTGAYTRLIASLLAGQGAAIGIDTQPAMLAQAYELAKQEGWGEVVTFAVGQPEKLPVPDACADRVFCNSLLWRQADPIAALREMRRALRPGGRLIAAEPDGGLIHSYHPDRPRLAELEQRFQESYARGARARDQHDYDIGRRLPALFLSAGLVAVRAYPRLFVSAGCDLGDDPKAGLVERLAEYQAALQALRDDSAEAQAQREQRAARARAGGMSARDLAEHDRLTLEYLTERAEHPERILTDGSTYMYGGVFCEGMRYEGPEQASAR